MPVFLSISLLVHIALGGAVLFEPDWDLVLPIDAFELPQGTDYTSITVQYTPQTSGEDQTAGPRRLIVRKTEDGALRMFPLYYQQDFLQMVTRFLIDEDDFMTGQITGFTGGREEFAVNVEFLEYAGADYERENRRTAAPERARVSLNDGVYWVSFAYAGSEIYETWFDEEGAPLFLYRLNFNAGGQCTRVRVTGAEFNQETVFSYDSFGKKTGIVSQEGRWNALYNDLGLRYLERRIDAEVAETGTAAESGAAAETGAGNYEFICGNPAGRPRYGRKTRGADGETVEYYTYQYQNDDAGNWIQRDTSTQEEKYGALITAGTASVRRTIEY